MFIHIFTYRLKCLLRDKEMIFWTLLFPLLLGTFFKMALGGIHDNSFETINIAVVQSDSYNVSSDFKNVLERVSTGDKPMFNVTETDILGARKLIEERKVIAYLTVDDEIKVFVQQSGLGQTIVKIFVENYQQSAAAVETILMKDPQNMDTIGGLLSTRHNYLSEVPISNSEPNGILIAFYSLIAMTCVFGATMGLKEVMDIQADQSERAARSSLVPVNKLKRYLYSMAASLVIHFGEVVLLIAYLHFALGVDFGERTPYIFLTALIGSATGLSFGSFISSVVKKSEGIKTAIMVSTTMIGSFLAGMMFHQIKYIVSENVPFLAMINPVNIITDAFYSLYYYDTLRRYWLNMGLATIFIIIFSVGTYLVLRRQKYASI
ncbi:UNVERIFIED_CONTAM: ABC-2 type transport system permease protein [Acetivibrio alkalicellulosi]